MHGIAGFWLHDLLTFIWKLHLFRLEHLPYLTRSIVPPASLKPGAGKLWGGFWWRLPLGNQMSSETHTRLLTHQLSINSSLSLISEGLNVMILGALLSELWNIQSELLKLEDLHFLCQNPGSVVKLLNSWGTMFPCDPVTSWDQWEERFWYLYSFTSEMSDCFHLFIPLISSNEMTQF